MTLICGALSADITLNCADKPIAGVKSRLHIINHDDILSVTRDGTNPIIVTAMALKTGKKAWTWDVYKRNHKPGFTTQDAEFSTNYKHVLKSVIPSWDNATKAQVEQLTTGYVVVIVENLQNTTDAAFEIYGLKSGLRAPDLARDLAANEGLATLTLQNDNDMFEDHIPSSFAVSVSSAYSYTATLAAIVALETAAS